MAIAFVRSATGTGTSANPAATLASAPAQDDLLIGFVSTQAANAINAANSYTKRTQIDSSRNGCLLDKIAGGSESATQQPATITSTTWGCAVLEYSGIDTASRLEVENAVSDTGSPKTSPAVNPTDSIDVLVIGAAFNGSSGAFSGELVNGSTTGVTERTEQTVSAASQAVWDWIGTTVSGNYTTETVVGSGTVGGCWIAIYKAAVSGATLSASDSGALATEDVLGISIPVTDSGALASELVIVRESVTTDSGSSTETTLFISIPVTDAGALAAELATLAAAINAIDSGSSVEDVLARTLSTVDTGSITETLGDRTLASTDDSALASELASLLAAFSSTDSGALASEIVVLLSQLFSVTDSGALASEIAVITAAVLASDTGALASELVTTFGRELIDSGALSAELVTVLSRALVDSGSITEVSLLEALSFFSVSDSGALASEIASVAAGIVASDSGALASEVLAGRAIYLTDAGEALLETFRRTRSQDPRAGATVRVGAILSTETAIVVGVQQRVERVLATTTTHTAAVEGPEQRDVRTALSES